MPLNQEVRSLYNGHQNTTAVVMVTSPAAAGISIASGAPGAYSIVLADAAVAVDLWALALTFDTPAAGALFTTQLSTPAAGTTVRGACRFEVATDAGAYFPYNFAVPIKVVASATNGLAVRQLLASGQTINVSVIYCTGLDG